MADEEQPDLPELSDLIVLQRRTLSVLGRLVEAAAEPRRIEIHRDSKGNIIGATSMAAADGGAQLEDKGNGGKE